MIPSVRSGRCYFCIEPAVWTYPFVPFDVTIKLFGSDAVCGHFDVESMRFCERCAAAIEESDHETLAMRLVRAIETTYEQPATTVGRIGAIMIATQVIRDVLRGIDRTKERTRATRQ